MSARRRWAWPLVPLYGAALATKDAVRATGLLPTRRLGWPVISIGSLSAGGAGKTPVTISLARLLEGRGWQVDVLTRGYGRTGGGVERVDPEEVDAADRFGDEPLLIARRTGAPVWVGKSRVTAGRAAENAPMPAAPQQRRLHYPEPQGFAGEEEMHGDAEPLRAHLLDDGAQHRALHRDFELLLLTEEDLQDTLLPAGNLREPLTALRRADALAVREEELPAIAAWLKRAHGPEVPVWTIRRSLHFPAPLGVFGAGLRPLAFCAVARPENFAAMLTAGGCGIVDTVVFPDHHRYTERDLQLMTRMAQQLRATGLVTTEKDGVKLSPAMRERLEREVGPLMVVRLDANFVYESPVVRTLEQRLRAMDKGNRAAFERVR